MKVTRKLLAVVAVAGSVATASGCSKKDDDDDDDEKEEVSAYAVPTVAFSMPLPASASLADQADDMLTGRVERVNSTITDLNEEIARINKEYPFTEAASITGKGQDGTESGTLTVLDDGSYNKQVVICVGGKVSSITKWSDDGKNIASQRDLNQKPDKPEDVKVSVTFAESDAKSLAVQFYGVPAGVPTDADGSMSATWDDAKQLADGSYTVRGVLDFFNPGAALGADEYLTGTMTSAGAGKFVGYSSRATNTCGSITFDEADPTNLWCNSREIGADAWYTLEEAAAAWTGGLNAVGVAPKSNLGEPALTATCP